ncbi:MAG: hypothetical protein UV61_C0019G0022 [Candidatus Gottesmanbacteria bacterium GW2011_GWB1_43_11]|uniref:Uncharacterized protein n=1 Tax=Candidatus Gottesmanbacteria bacterium GW2011_GWB1_43_11 TaxID=1618446 RepID=A0A0G1FEI3_9BACT|nr:MAG: hypothetical protein UV04_C0014G0023 [Candidatus Gottesmanbacteria bacterium GW2011_GWA2_42_16]KKS54813.1 MAG: hypothetical protein UV17_C0015G0016 [Candidatus Gottesmanbacteria bacterium GW2011_GWA1_42_26]KKS85258.1 MAG: hypothetical protein UV61_C0019G0022 [Candidatus Gottesmanbacteria bacterium GW2011_GWB1_43_11]OGG08804.1 MAG: hypothetical protein A2699_05810 [Candidatus Gottesmanbacteria bacterium RIFCSPHIGHO2_01_FULL_43_15]OGG28023.1 MAG: hypothetical protein A3A59_04690 [Candidat
MSLFSIIFGQGRGPESRAVSTPEVIDIPSGIIIEGSADSSGWDQVTPYHTRAIIPPDTTKLTIGLNQLSLIARIDPNRGIEGVEIVSAQDLKRGSAVTLPEHLLIAVPRPNQIITEDGRLFCQTVGDPKYFNNTEKLNIVRIFFQTHLQP